VNYTSVPTITLSGGAGAGASIAVDASKFIDNTGGSFTKLGPGTLTLAGVSTYAGDTVVDAGTLNVTHGINTPAATVYVATGGTLNTPSIVADTLTIGGAPRTAAAAVPEPGTLALLALAVLGFAGMAWRKRK
jgi:autotransporter-associated beta strand protein